MLREKFGNLEGFVWVERDPAVAASLREYLESQDRENLIIKMVETLSVTDAPDSSWTAEQQELCRTRSTRTQGDGSEHDASNGDAPQRFCDRISTGRANKKVDS